MLPSDWERLEHYLEYCENLQGVKMALIDGQLRRARVAYFGQYPKNRSLGKSSL